MAEDQAGTGGDGDVTMRLWRGDETGGAFADYVMPAQEGEVVLDVIHRVQATQAPDLACRWNCKAGKCGSCSAEINGRPALLCMTRMDSLPAGEAVTVAPMRTFPILRDLVTDVSYNYEVAKRIPPFSPGPRPPTNRRSAATACSRSMWSGARSSANASSASCARTSATSSVTTKRTRQPSPDPGSSPGRPSSRCIPWTSNDRRELLQQEQGLGKCNITKCCTEVCPEHIKITDNAIIPLKERVVDAAYDPVAWLGRKILKRTKRTPIEASVTSPATGPAAVQPPFEVHGSPDPDHRAGAGTPATGAPVADTDPAG